MPIVQIPDTDPFRTGNLIARNPFKSGIDKSFEEILESKAKEVVQEKDAKATEVVEKSEKDKTKKTNTENLPDINKIVRNEKNDSQSTRNTYMLLAKFKEERKFFQDDPRQSIRQKVLSDAVSVAGQPLIQHLNDQTPKRSFSRSQLLSIWERMSPTVTEDPMKKSVRIDIPLLNDVQALVLRLHADQSISASLLGSETMAELIRRNKDRLDRNLKHHNLSLREFNTYYSELTFNMESGTRKGKKKKSKQKAELDII